MIIPAKISPRLIMNVSSLYTDPIRVFMEFIDNSIDAAESTNTLMSVLTGEGTEYKDDVKVEIKIGGKWYKDGYVKITDNCTGIKELRNVVEKIGNSEKKSQSWLNGQFGYGLYSFLAICDNLEIRTKHKDNDYTEYIKITKNDFLLDDLTDLKFTVTQRLPHVSVSGTEVKLSGFSKVSWLELDPLILKAEIENHFELLL